MTVHGFGNDLTREHRTIPYIKGSQPVVHVPLGVHLSI